MFFIKMWWIFCFCWFRMEPTCLSVGAYCLWESWSSSCHYHTSLCSRTSQWTPPHPLPAGPGSAGICFSCALLVPHSLDRWSRKVSGLSPPHLCAGFGLLYIKCHLPTFYVLLPSRVYSDILHRSGLWCLVPLYCGSRPRCWKAGMCEHEWNSEANIFTRELSCTKFLWILVHHADCLVVEFLGFIAKTDYDAGRWASPAVWQFTLRKTWRGVAPPAQRRNTSSRGTEISGGTASHSDILDTAKHLLVVTARRLQCSYQWSPAVCAEFHLFAVWGCDLSPVCGPGQYSKSTGLLFSHVFCTEVKTY